MGKLHTIRRAVERKPSEWYRVRDDGTLNIKGASFNKRTGQWGPCCGYYSWSEATAYKNFVAHIIQEILNERERRNMSK